MLLARGRLVIEGSADRWLDAALSYPGIQLIGLTPHIALESTRLPGGFHRDPVDRLLVATARVHNCPLVTADQEILAYPHVETIKP